jgi:glyoxylase-like metal-dependent hydrolase (beta-lactamase superfamily II)
MRAVRAANPSAMTLDGTRTFLVGGARPAVVDPGPADAEHLRRLEEALGGAVPVAILLTHAHADHAGGAAALAARTGAPVRMLPGALHPLPPGLRLGAWLHDGERVETDAGPVEVVATPGHAPEHACFLWRGGGAPAGGALLVGDLFMGQGDTTLVASPEGDVGAYLRSLDRVEATGPGILHPAHGPALADPAAAVARYRAHRLERVRQVERALARAPSASPGELVDLIYGDELPAALRAAAEGSVRAMADFLRAASAPD